MDSREGDFVPSVSLSCRKFVLRDWSSLRAQELLPSPQRPLASGADGGDCGGGGGSGGGGGGGGGGGDGGSVNGGQKRLGYLGDYGWGDVFIINLVQNSVN